MAMRMRFGIVLNFRGDARGSPSTALIRDIAADDTVIQYFSGNPAKMVVLTGKGGELEAFTICAVITLNTIRNHDSFHDAKTCYAEVP